MLPVVAMLFRLRKTTFVSPLIMQVMLFSSLFYYLPSFYWMLDKSHIDNAFISMVRVSREMATVILYMLISSGFARHIVQILKQINWLEPVPSSFKKVS